MHISRSPWSHLFAGCQLVKVQKESSQVNKPLDNLTCPNGEGEGLVAVIAFTTKRQRLHNNTWSSQDDVRTSIKLLAGIQQSSPIVH